MSKNNQEVKRKTAAIAVFHVYGAYEVFEHLWQYVFIVIYCSFTVK